MNRTGIRIRGKQKPFTASWGSLDKDGYIKVKYNGYTARRTTLLAERALGKALPAGAQVHHVNENKADDFTPFNLVICPNQHYHRMLHNRARALWRRHIMTGLVPSSTTLKEFLAQIFFDSGLG